MHRTLSPSLPCLVTLLALAAGCGPGPAEGSGGNAGAGAGGATGGSTAGGTAGQAGSAGSGAAGSSSTLDVGDVKLGTLNAAGGVVFGVTSEIDSTALTSLHILRRVNGNVTGEQTLQAPFGFPIDVPFVNLQGGDEVEVQLDAPGGDPSYALPPMSQTAATTVVAGELKLLRVPFSWYCAYGTICDPPGTCRVGKCTEAHVPPAALEDYTADWSKYSYCKPKGAGAPQLSLSVGSTSFVPVNDKDTVHLIAGFQGGHHLWIALRMRNIQQASMLTLTGHLPGLGIDVGPLQWQSTFNDDPHLGQCETTYLTFQLDYALPYTQFLDQDIQVTAQLEDMEGAKASDTRLLHISPDVIPQ